MSIVLGSISDGATVNHSLPILSGEVKPPLQQSSVEVVSEKDGRAITWPVHSGRFKALVPLSQGENKIHLKYYAEILTITLHYEVPKVELFVRPVYIKCCDDDGLFQGFDDQDRSVESAEKRLALGAKLMQTFTAEKLREHGFGPKTFVLENDLDPCQPQCHVFTSRLKVSEAREMCGSELWMHYAKELMASKEFEQKENCKWLAFLSFTRYSTPQGIVPKTHSEVLNSTKGHTALGGGGLALYGTGTLHTWAESIEQLPKCFTDSHKIDRTKLMDDSAYREFYWANYSTGLGASLHELGHTFDLAHTPTGIMARGFDDLYRVFLVNPPTTRGSTPADNSRSASPIPYSPKQSPIHRPKSVCSRSGSPAPCPPSHPRPLSMGDDPKVIQIEAAFKRLQGPSKNTFVQNNYDGSQTKKSITRYPDGTELVTEITVELSGEQIVQEQLRHTPSGKTRTTMSVSMWPCGGVDQCAPDSPEGSVSSVSSHGSLRRSRLWEYALSNGLNFQEMRCRDGGAHWYRSSAVLLRYHRWFNPPCEKSSPPTFKGNLIESSSGLRLVELRSQPEGVVFHHWEFLSDTPPTTFLLDRATVLRFQPQAKEIGVLVEDDSGNILKKKLHLQDLEEDGGSTTGEST